MKSNRQSLLLLGTGAALMLFSNGRWIIPYTTWLFPIFFLRFMRLQKPFKGFLLVASAMAFVNMIIWWKIIPAPPAVYFLTTGLMLQVFALCFLADRLLAIRMNGILSTLVFPVAWCSIEYLSSLNPAKASWTSLAYTQADNLPLMQFTSVTGIWGISFLITWFASVVNWMWAQSFEWKKFKKEAITFISIATAIFIFGTVRISLPSPTRSVRTASVVQARGITAALKTCKWTDAKGISKYSNGIENNLLEKTQQAARAGAKMILWQECAGIVPKTEEKSFIEKATTIAAQEKIYLLMTLWSVPDDFPKHLIENKMIIIDPGGQIRSMYVKNNPVPGAEPIVKGVTPMPFLKTPFGMITAAICYDGDFPNFIRTAGKNKAGIMFLPANDWKAVDPIHTNMAITRAIENGFSLVHPAGQGFSVATDSRGRIISSMDYFNTDEQVVYADVPVQHVFTLYPQIGDLFAWLCVAAFITFLIVPVFKKYFLPVKSHISEAHPKMKTSPDVG